MSEPDHDDLLRRATAAARRTHPGAEVRGLRQLEGGVSSLTYASVLRTPERELPVVLKVAPPGLAPVRNRDVLRQARVLRHLEGLAGFPVPRVVFEDAGEPPGTPPMFAMELRAGESYEPLLDTSAAPPSAEVAAARMLAAVRTLARLHGSTPASLGLAEEPVTPVAEELARWERLFATVGPDLATGHERLHARLVERVPADTAPRLLHGDYRLANMLFVGPALEAVIDWEIWSVGDPRSDLAWVLMHAAPAHVFHEERSPADLAAGAALPTRDELLAAYVSARRAHGADEETVLAATRDLDWFLGVCFYKTASTTAVIVKRDRKRAEPTPQLVVAARHLGDVLAAGHASLD